MHPYPLIQSRYWALLAVGAVVLAGFGVHQRRLTNPLVELSLFRDRDSRPLW